MSQRDDMVIEPSIEAQKGASRGVEGRAGRPIPGESKRNRSLARRLGAARHARRKRIAKGARSTMGLSRFARFGAPLAAGAGAVAVAAVALRAATGLSFEQMAGVVSKEMLADIPLEQRATMKAQQHFTSQSDLMEAFGREGRKRDSFASLMTNPEVRMGGHAELVARWPRGRQIHVPFEDIEAHARVRLKGAQAYLLDPKYPNDSIADLLADKAAKQVSGGLWEKAQTAWTDFWGLK